MDFLSRGVEHVDAAATLSIELFCDEYLGRPGAPVPFGGRADALASLDAFLADEEARCLLLSAPAGMGKSALLTRWAAQLLARDGLAVAFVPVSLRFDASLARCVLRALAARLSHLHAAPLDLSREQPTDWWRAQVERLASTALPDGRTLVVILDGVDETAESLLSESLFPPGVFARSKVVVSVRDRAGDALGATTLRALGWSDAPGVRRLSLAPLSPEGLFEVLSHLNLSDGEEQPSGLPAARDLADVEPGVDPVATPAAPSRTRARSKAENCPTCSARSGSRRPCCARSSSSFDGARFPPWI